MYPVFDTQEAVPEAFRDHYEERDGKWHFKAPEDDGLKTAIAAERQKREAAEKLAKKAADELKSLQTKADAAKAGLTEEQLEKLRADIRNDLEKEYAQFKTDAERLGTENRTLKLDNAVKALMGSDKVKVRGERMEALWKLIGERFDLTDDGKPMVKANPGVTVEKYLADTVKKEFPEFFTGTQASGGGAAPAGAGGQTVSPDAIIANPLAALSAARQAGKTE